MDPDLLRHYNDELTHLREVGGEFARRFPKIASRLGMEDMECKITVVNSRHDFSNGLAQSGLDLILSDFSMPRFDGFSALRLAREQRPEVPFIFLSGTIGEELAIEALHEGATDYVIKDRMARLPAAIRRALAEVETRHQRERAEAQLRDQAALLNLAQDAICAINMDQTITYWNQSAERLYRWTEKEALGRKANEILFYGDVSGPLAPLQFLHRCRPPLRAWRGR